MPFGKGRVCVSGTLFNVAVEAAKSIKAPLRQGLQQPALTSIVFSVIALEAFVNEATEVAADYLAYANEPQVVTAFVEFMSDAERARMSLESKFILSNWILSGKRLARGEPAYQDFSLLLGLRNDLVHFKPNAVIDLSHASPDEMHQRVVGKFRSKNILATGTESPLTPWTQLITTKAVALWSCRTAAQMVVDFVQKVPKGGWRTFLDSTKLLFTSHNCS
jgi:hypothetical protein